MRKFVAVFAFLMIGAWSQAFAKQDVILIHGYSNLFDNNTIGSEIFSKAYWFYWEQKAFKNVRVKHISWDSKARINNQMTDIVKQYKAHLAAGHCAEGCVVYTHSTGGLVIDMLLSQARESKGRANDFSVIWDKTSVIVPVASAGGGVNLAVYAGDIVNGACTNFLLKTAIEAVLPFVQCGKIETLGAGYDLQPNVARSINGSDNIRTPALMIAGFGNMVGNIIKPFLVGTSDGLVAMHSACGGNKFLAYDSCVNYMGPDGELAAFNAPTLYRDHFPYIMTKEGHGSELMPGLANTDLLSTKTESLVDNYGFSNVATETSTSGFWFFAKQYKNIKNDERHLSEIIGGHFYY